MKAEIISVGTEILLGEIVDTNASWLAARLPALGVDLYFKSVVGDNIDRIVDTLERALDRSDLVIMTGGLGPTDDDLTRESIAAALGEEMFIDEDMCAPCGASSKGAASPSRSATSSRPASSLRLRHPQPARHRPRLVGREEPPGEGRPLHRRHARRPPRDVPHVGERGRAAPDRDRRQGVLVTRVLKTVGMGESMLDEMIAPFPKGTRTRRSASTPSRTASTSASPPRPRPRKPPASSSPRSKRRPASSSARSSGAPTTSRWRARSAPCCASAA